MKQMELTEFAYRKIDITKRQLNSLEVLLQQRRLSTALQSVEQATALLEEIASRIRSDIELHERSLLVTDFDHIVCGGLSHRVS